jgi:hypothetical protein
MSAGAQRALPTGVGCKGVIPISVAFMLQRLGAAAAGLFAYLNWSG